MSLGKRLIVLFFVITFCITFAAGMTALVTDQIFRTLLVNEPLSGLVGQLMPSIESNNAPDIFASETKTDISKLSTPFGMIFDKNKALVSTTVLVGTANPDFPKNFLSLADSQAGEGYATWQPQPNVRLATIVKKYANGYLVVGIPLTEFDKKVGGIIPQIEIVLLSTIAALTLLFIILYFILRARKVKKEPTSITAEESHEEVSEKQLSSDTEANVKQDTEKTE